MVLGQAAMDIGLQIIKPMEKMPGLTEEEQIDVALTQTNITVDVDVRWLSRHEYVTHPGVDVASPT